MAIARPGKLVFNRTAEGDYAAASPASGHLTDDTTASYNLQAHYKTPRPSRAVAMSPIPTDDNDDKQPEDRYYRQLSAHFELMRGLEVGQRYKNRPPPFSGRMMLQRKMFGKRRRYCVVKDGILHVYRSTKEVDKGRIWRKIDLAHSVVSYRKADCIILIDADDRNELYRFKIDRQTFDSWIDYLRMHRLFRQDQFCGEQFAAEPNTPRSPLTEYLPGIPSTPASETDLDGVASKKRIVEWLLESEEIDNLDKEFNEASALVFELGSIIEQLEKCADLASERRSIVDGDSPKTAGRSLFSRLSFRNRNDQSDSAKKMATPIPTLAYREKGALRLPTSLSTGSFVSENSQDINKSPRRNPTLSASPATKRLNREESDLFHRDAWFREEYLRLAREAHRKFRELLRSTSTEHAKLKDVQKKLDSLDKVIDGGSAVQTGSSGNSSPVKRTEKGVYKAGKAANMRYGEVVDPARKSDKGTDTKFGQSSIVQTSSSVYFDASEALPTSTMSRPSPPASDFGSSFTLSDIESDNTGEEKDGAENGTSESNSSSMGNDEGDCDDANDRTKMLENGSVCLPRYRERLPSAMPPAPSLFKILYNAIGRDFTRFPLPAAALEPLSLLQVLCEELEYTDLLDQAVACSDPHMRMVFVAAFAASRYGSTTYRVGRKPFNPLLGETFEFVNPNLGWKYLAQQVCHHPSVSACFAEGRGWTWWQAAEAAVVFGGRSIEARPTTPVFIYLQRWKETYTWNKVTTYLTNLLSGPPFTIDHYGEMVVQCLESENKCKLHFEKMTSHRGSMNGKVMDSNGHVVHSLSGKWTDSLYLVSGSESSSRCIWRLAALPSDHDRYYGFTRFALSLNETKPEIHGNTPCTDSRNRPDQRALENGDVNDAEKLKKNLESSQRERLKNVKSGALHMWFRETSKDSDAGVKWEFTGDYWRSKEGDFKDVSFVSLW